MTTTEFRRILSKNAPWIIPAALFLIALGIRVGFFISMKDDPVLLYPILDADSYAKWAKQILSGTSFTEHAYFTEPGYAFLLAFFLRLFEDGETAIVFFQILIGSLTPVLIFCATKRLASSILVAAVSGFLATLAAPPVFYEVLLLKTSVELFLLSMLALIIAVSWEKRDPKRFFGIGVIIGLTALVKANILLAAPILAIATLFRNRRPDRYTAYAAIALIFGVLLAISPAAIRNYYTDGSLTLINASGGPNLYIGVWEGADGSLKPPEFISVNPEQEEATWRAFAEASLNRKLSADQVSGFWTSQAAREIIAHPVRFVDLTLKKIGLLISSRVLDDNYFPGYGTERFPPLGYLLPAWILIIMGILGTVIAMTDRALRARWLPVGLIALVYAGTLVLTHIAERYRLALLPFLLPGAGLFLVTMIRRIRSGSFLPIFWLAFPFLILSGFAFSSGDGASSTSGPDMKIAIAKKASDADDRKVAHLLGDSALRENPFHVPSLLSTSRLALEEDRFEDALSYARRALRADPEAGTAELGIAYEATTGTLAGDTLRDSIEALSRPSSGTGKISDPDYWTGMDFFRKRDFENALPFFERAAARDPENMAALGNLATTYKNTGKPDLALPLFKRIIEKDPYNLAIRFNLAQFHEAKKDAFAAMKEYESIQTIVPGFHLVRFNIAELALKRNDKNRARTELSAFIDENRGDPRKEPLVREAERTLERIGK
ncbi:MAG: tetratricopeptide repeat protein [Candidatus Moranbacteria bacterium]|nr:tetratricopeptide repeat protein [Candidatus Moranbacteria bacterium]